MQIFEFSELISFMEYSCLQVRNSAFPRTKILQVKKKKTNPQKNPNKISGLEMLELSKVSKADLDILEGLMFMNTYINT